MGGLTPGHVRRGRLCQSLSLCLCSGWVAACADCDVIEREDDPSPGNPGPEGLRDRQETFGMYKELR